MLPGAAPDVRRRRATRCTRSPSSVLSAAYFRATTHIGLRPTPRGFGTPVFGDGERVRVDSTALVHERAGHDAPARAHDAHARRPRSSACRSARRRCSRRRRRSRPTRRSRSTATPRSRSPTGTRSAAALLADLRAAHHDSARRRTRSSGPSTSTSRASSATQTPAPAPTTAPRPATPRFPSRTSTSGPWDPARRTGVARHATPSAPRAPTRSCGTAGEAGGAGRHFFESALAQLVG